MKKNIKIILIISCIVSIAYYSLIKELSKTVLNVITVAFIVLHLLCLCLIFRSLRSKKNIIVYTAVLLVSFVVVLGSRVYLYENNYIVDESHDPWNNIYVEYESTTYSKEVGFDDREERKSISYSWEKEFTGDYKIQDYIIKDEFTYFVVMLSNSYEILKVDSDENVIVRTSFDKNIDSKKVLIMENKTDEIYLYEVYCSNGNEDSIIQDYKYKVTSFDSDLNISSTIDIREENLVALNINKDYLYGLSDEENMLIKYDLYGNIVNKKEYKIDVDSLEPQSYNMFVDNKYIYLYQSLYISDKSSEEQKVYDQLAVYNLDFDYQHTIIFEGVDEYYISSMSNGKKAPGENFMVDNNGDIYTIGTKYFGIELLDTKEIFYMNIATLETLHSKDIAEEFNMHTSLAFTMALLITLPMYLIYGIKAYFNYRRSQIAKT